MVDATVGATVWLVDATVGATESDVLLVRASKLDVRLVGATVGLVGANVVLLVCATVDASKSKAGVARSSCGCSSVSMDPRYSVYVP